jgi:hypothetical protein
MLTKEKEPPYRDLIRWSIGVVVITCLLGLPPVCGCILLGCSPTAACLVWLGHAVFFECMVVAGFLKERADGQ